MDWALHGHACRIGGFGCRKVSGFLIAAQWTLVLGDGA
jgi:hypothetical protein